MPGLKVFKVMYFYCTWGRVFNMVKISKVAVWTGTMRKEIITVKASI